MSDADEGGRFCGEVVRRAADIEGVENSETPESSTRVMTEKRVIVKCMLEG